MHAKSPIPCRRWPVPSRTYPVSLASLLSAALLIACPGMAYADVISTVDRGWYRGEGFHDPNNQNYLTGSHVVTGAPSNDYRSFYVFDLAQYGHGSNDTIVSATLQLQNPVFGMDHRDSVQELSIFEVNTNVNTLTSGTGGLAAFNDLGQGTALGSVIAREVDLRFGGILNVSLNANGLAALNHARGGLIALGAAVTAHPPGLGHKIFSRSDASHSTVLNITVVPEPGGLSLAGLAAVALLRRRRAA